MNFGGLTSDFGVQFRMKSFDVKTVIFKLVLHFQFCENPVFLEGVKLLHILQDMPNSAEIRS